MAVNPHETLSREKKAQELASVLLYTHSTWAGMIRDLLDMEDPGEAEDPWFRMVEDHAGVNPASAATWTRVAEILEERAERARPIWNLGVEEDRRRAAYALDATFGGILAPRLAESVLRRARESR